MNNLYRIGLATTLAGSIATGRGGDRGRGDRGGRGARGARGRREMKPTNYDCVVTRPEGLEKKGTYCSFSSYLLKSLVQNSYYYKPNKSLMSVIIS